MSVVYYLNLQVCPEFVNLLSHYDIVGLQETKTDLSDEIYIAGFVTYLFHREKLSRNRSGGIAL